VQDALGAVGDFAEVDQGAAEVSGAGVSFASCPRAALPITAAEPALAADVKKVRRVGEVVGVLMVSSPEREAPYRCKKPGKAVSSGAGRAAR
jgi:hypothetical protein